MVLCLDDAQWLGSPTLSFLQTLLQNGCKLRLLIIIAYCPDGLSPEHKLLLLLKTLAETKLPIHTLTLEPFSVSDINAFLSDVLAHPSQKILPLAELIRDKTQGNPFFIRALLQHLQKENLLTFTLPIHFDNQAENESVGWHWNLDEIEQVSITDNVVTLTLDKIKSLDSPLQDLFALAACIGSGI